MSPVTPIVMASNKIWILNSILCTQHNLTSERNQKSSIFRIQVQKFSLGCLLEFILNNFNKSKLKESVNGIHKQLQNDLFLSFWSSYICDLFCRFDVRDRPMSIARVYSDQTLFDEPTRAVMNVTTSPAALIISKLIPADSGR